jgi:hypothetical protein
MDRRRVLATITAGLFAVGLSGCTSFSPVYGDISGAGLADARFNFAPPTNRLEQVILNRLSVAFPNAAGPDDPVLRVSASSSTLAAALSKDRSGRAPVNVRVEASVSIVRVDQTLFSARRFTDTAYQGGGLVPGNLASADGAREQAAESTAEALRAAILAGYRPGAVNMPVR